jgi:hypothetical protein
MRSFLLPALKFLVSGLLIAMVLRNIDLDSLTGQLAGQSRGWLIAAAAVTAAQIPLAGLRWDQVIRGLGAKVRIEAVVRVTYIGTFFNSWLLGNFGGDVARAILAPDGGIGRTRIVYSVLFDRVATLAGLGLTILPVIVLNVGPLARSMPLVASLAVAAVPFAGLTALGLMAPALGRRTNAAMLRVGELGLSWRRLCEAPARLGGALAIGAVSQVAIAAVAYSLARAQHLDVSFVDFLILIPPVVLLAALPISVGGWGVRENAMIIAMAPLGVMAGSALLISVQAALLANLVSLPGGILWLARHGLRRGPPAAASMPLGCPAPQPAGVP